MSEFRDSAPSAPAVFYRSYSRRKSDGTRESFAEAISRTVGDLADIGGFTDEQRELCLDVALKQHAFPSGRALWVAGTEWSKKPENFYGYYNCHGGILSGPHVFGRLMDMAMCGTGTGVLLERELVEALPIVSTKLVLSSVIDSRDIDGGDPATLVVSDPEASTACIVVGDSRKGWVDAYQALINLAFESSDEEVYVELNLSQVRGKGRKLKGFGGVANPAGLRTAFEKIISLLGGAFGRKLTTVETCLLVDEAASAVVAGNLRRCLPEDALVHTSKGLVPIKDVQVGDMVQTPIGFRHVTNKFDQGIQDVYELETNGPKPRATLNHRIAVLADARGGIDWVEVQDLKEGHRLMHSTEILAGEHTSLPDDFTAQRPANSRTAKNITIPQLSSEVAWLIGLTHGDGYVAVGRNKHNKPFGSIHWATNGTKEEESIRIYEKICSALALFGVGCTRSLVKGENTAVVTCSSIRLAEYFLKYIKRPNEPIEIPSFILRGTSDVRAAYLAGVMDSDGSANNRPPHLVTTVYPKFARQIAAVASSLGIACRTGFTLPQKASWRIRHHVTIPALKSLYNNLIAPHSIKGKIKEGLKMYGFTVPGEIMREAYCCAEMNSMGFSASKTVPSNYERYIAESDIDIDIPVTFRGLGSYDSIQTYDIEVEEAHCFYCDGYLTHNSAGIRLFSSDDEEAKNAKQGLYKQDENGNWSVDPKRESLRLANHTVCYHHRPTLKELKESVRKQFISGEGAIQFSPEAIARANADLLDSTETKKRFIETYVKEGKEAGKKYLKELADANDIECDDRQLEHRILRYSANPCFAPGTLITTSDGAEPIEGLVGKIVKVFDGSKWVEIDNFRVTGTNQPVYNVNLVDGRQICATEYHDFILGDNSRKQLKDLLPGDKLKAICADYLPTSPGEVDSIEFSHIADKVYCCTVPGTHSVSLANGIVTGQCHEIIGNDFMCNLGEVHLNTIDPADKEGQHRAFYATGLMVASLLQHRFPDEEIQYSREQDPIVAVCLSGLFDFFVSAFGVEWLDWMIKGRRTGNKYKKFTRLERQYLESWKHSAWQGVAEYCTQAGLKMPNRYTAVQPAGSKSLLTGASPGWHPPKSQRFIRRITFGIDDPLVAALRDYGYNVVPAQSARDEEGNLLNDVNDPRVHEVLVEIPTEVPWANLPGADAYDLSKIPVESQMGLYMQVQRHYSTHTTSATIEFRENEIDTLAELVYKEIQNDGGYIGVAMLARFDANETFPRLPFEPISKETYDRMMAKIKAYRVTLPEDITILDLLKPYDHPDHVLEPQDTACANAACLAKIDQEEAKGLL